MSISLSEKGREQPQNDRLIISVRKSENIFLNTMPLQLLYKWCYALFFNKYLWQAV